MKHLAIVEDNPDNLMLVEAILDGQYDLSTYSSGREALAGMVVRVPDLVLLDMSLPEMDGIQVLQAMRTEALLASVPTIALTAHAMTGDRARFLAAGFDDYVSKPIEDEELLLGAIRRLLR